MGTFEAFALHSCPTFQHQASYWYMLYIKCLVVLKIENIEEQFWSMTHASHNSMWTSFLLQEGNPATIYTTINKCTHANTNKTQEKYI